MADQTVDYDAIAKKYGGKVLDEAPAAKDQPREIDYNSISNYGGAIVDQTPAPKQKQISYDLSKYGGTVADSPPDAAIPPPYGMERLGGLPGVPTPRIDMQYSDYGKVPISEMQPAREPFETLPALEQMAQGGKKILTAGPTPTKPADAKQLMSGASDLIEGSFQAAGPAIIPALVAAPLAATGTLVGMGLASRGAEEVGKKLGASPETSRFLGNAVALAIAGGGVRYILGKGDAALAKHNEAARSLLEQERTRGNVKDQIDEIFRGESHPVVVDGKPARVEYAGGTVWRVVNEQGKTIFGGKGRDVTEWLQTKGAVADAPVAEPTPIVRAAPTAPPPVEPIAPDSAPAKPVVQTAPQAPTVEAGHTYATPSGEIAVSGVDGKGIVTFDQTLPDGSVLRGNRLPMARFQKMVAPPPRSEESPAPVAPPAAPAVAAGPQATPDEILAQAPAAPLPATPVEPPVPAPVPPAQPQQSPVAAPVLPTEVVAPPEPEAVSVSPANPGREAVQSHSEGKETAGVPGAAPEQTPPPQVEPWQMTRAAYRQQNADLANASGRMIGAQPFEGARFVERPNGQVERVGEHQLAVEQALADGKPVPAEVLADYPHLTQSAAKPPGGGAQPTPKTPTSLSAPSNEGEKREVAPAPRAEATKPAENIPGNIPAKSSDNISPESKPAPAETPAPKAETPADKLAANQKRIQELEAALKAQGAAVPPEKPKSPTQGQNIATALRRAADGLDNQIEAKRNPAIANQNPTARRAGIADGMAREADRLERIQKTLAKLADLHESGEVPPVLAGIRSRSVLESVIPAYHSGGRDAGKIIQQTFPSASLTRHDVQELLEKSKGMPGTADGHRILERSRYAEIPHFTESEIPEIEKVMDAAVKRGYKDTYTRSRITGPKRLYAAGINEGNFAKAQESLANLGAKPSAPTAEMKIREAERDLIGTRIEGYFPTPKPLAERLVEEADIKPGMSVLEPSAGNGAIADAVREAAPDAKITAVERVERLRKILELKGHPVAEDRDFLEHQGEYDRIVMNPPFEHGQDVDHVRRAFDLLKLGGRMVAIMSEGSFYRSDKKATAFREWLEKNSGTSEKLPEGSFTGKDAQRQTGTATRIVIIDKPEARQPITVAPQYVKAAEESRANRAEFHRQQEAEEAAVARPDVEPQGKPAEVYTIKGRKVNVGFDVREAGDLVNSFEPHYPQEYQPRDTDRKGSRQRVEQRKGDMNGALMSDSRLASDGAPITLRNGTVITRNHGTQALKELYREKAGRAEKYKNWLVWHAHEFGLDPLHVSAMREPVLIRAITDELPSSEVVEFAREANMSSAARMSDAEMADMLSRRMTGALMDSFDPSEDGRPNPEFVRNLIQDLPVEEQSVFQDRDGKVSQTGARIIRNAVFAKAYPDPRALERMAESESPSLKNITSGMLAAAPGVAKFQEAVSRGDRFPLGIGPEIADAAAVIDELVRTGTPVKIWFDQSSMFGRDPVVESLVRVFSDNRRSAKRIGEFLKEYTEVAHAAGSPKQETMFGPPETPEKADVLAAAYQRAQERWNPQQDLLAQSEAQAEPEGSRLAPGEDAPARHDERPGALQSRSVGEPSLFGDDADQQSKKDAESYEDRLLGDQLTAQFKSGLAARPTKLKPAQNRGLFEEEGPEQDTLFARRSPGFYSALERAVESKMPAKATVPQILGIITNPQNGAKPDEVKWTGLQDWLLQQKGSVSKEAVLDYLKQNEVQVEEAVHGAPIQFGGWLKRVGFTVEEFNDLPDSSRERLWADYEKGRENNPIIETSTKFSQYTLPGGQNYRELLLTLPEKASANPAEVPPGYTINKFSNGQYGLFEPDGSLIASGYESEQQLLGDIPGILRDRGGIMRPKDQYTSPHWDEPNVLAHVRFDDRVGAGGEKILHVAEIQSDWHQQGRKTGYSGVDPERDRLDAELKRVELRLAEIRDLPAQKVGAEEQRLWAEQERLLRERNARGGGGQVPAAPFSKTWPELAFRRMLRYAAENGYDKLTWDTGETNADRYDLSKQVSRVTWEPTGDGDGQLAAYDLDGKQVMFEGTTEQKLPDYIGKEAANKLVQQPFSESDPSKQELSGLDLKTPAPGMTGFYDQILPAYAAKYGKKWGAKVTADHLPASGQREVSKMVDGRWGVFDTSSYLAPPVAEFDTEPEANRYLADNPKAKGPAVHAMTITPAMKASVMQGQPLFARPANVPSASNTGHFPQLAESPSPKGQTATLPEIHAYWKGAVAQPAEIDGQPVLWVNGSAMDVLLHAMGMTGAGQSSTETLGLAMRHGEWLNVLEEARAAEKDPRAGGYDEALARIGKQVADLVGVNTPGASLVRPLVVVQSGDSVKPEAIERTLNEELDHAKQMQLPKGLRGLPHEMLDSPAGKKAVDALARQGYRRPNPASPFYEQNRAVMTAEVGVRLMRGGRHAELNLTSEEAVDLAMQYIEGLERENGSHAEAIVEQTRNAIEQNQAALRGGSPDLDLKHETGARRPAQGREEGAQGPPAESLPGTEGPSAVAAKSPEVWRQPFEEFAAPEIAAKEDAERKYTEAAEPNAAVAIARERAVHALEAKRAEHYSSVLRAIREVRDVPQESLRAHPDLLRKASKRPSLGDLAKGEEGQSRVGQRIEEMLNRFREADTPKRNYSGFGLKPVLLPGARLHEVEQASRPVMEKALAAGSWQSIASTMTRTAVSAINKTLEGTEYNWLKMRAALTEDRLQALRDRWSDFANIFEDADDAQLQELLGASAENGRSFFLDLLGNIEGRNGLGQDLGQTAAALLEQKDWANLRRFVSDSFADAAGAVATILPPEIFEDYADFFANDPKGKQAMEIYRNEVEKPLERVHLENEGVLGVKGKTLGAYIPLTPFEPKPPTVGGRRLPMHKPKNPANDFATGLSPSYGLSMASFVDRVARDVRSNKRAALIQTLRDEGWSQRKPRGWDGEYVGPDGIAYEAVAKQVSEARTVIQNGKQTHIPGEEDILPKFLWKGLQPMLERAAPDTNDLNRVAHFFNGLALKGTPAELIFHSRGVIGAINANTPFLGGSGLDKFLSAPVLRWFAINAKLLNIDPTAPGNVAKLREMAEAGAVPSKMGKVTFDKEFAEAFGVKREFSFAPLLYGPKGIDARARILMYDIFKATYPNGSKTDLYHFVNQIGNYTPEFQGEIEKWVKRVGLGPFATAGMTRNVNAFHAWTGTGPGDWKTLLLQRILGGGIAAIAIWALSYHYLTGKWPTQDKRAKLFQIPVDVNGSSRLDHLARKHRTIGRALWGSDWDSGKTTGYLNLGSFFPIVERGGRLLGITHAFETRQLGGNTRQMLDAAESDVLNSLAHPMEGPAATAAWIGLTGTRPYVTGFQKGGKPQVSLFPAYADKRKPGFLGGLSPALSSGHVVPHPGMASEAGARTAATIGALNGFYENLGEGTGVLGSDRGQKGSWWLRMALDLTPATGVVKNATNPFARAGMLRKDRAAGAR